MLHANAKARVHDIGTPRLHMTRSFTLDLDLVDEDELLYCHVQGYCPQVICIEQGNDRAPAGCYNDRSAGMRDGRAFDQHGSDRCGSDQRDDQPGGGRTRSPPRGRFARPNQRHRPFLSDVQCDACKRVGHKAANCNMLAVALFVDRYVKKDMSELQHRSIEETWLARWKNKLGSPTRLPCQVMRTYCENYDITPDNLDLALDWECWPESDDSYDDE